jgi:hypothetical protein
MMFDHGCDSIAVACTTWNIKLLMNMNSNELLLTFVLTKFLFILVNYEAAKYGGMNLPIVNGPSDGNVVIAFMFFMPYLFGDNFYS